MIDLMRQDTGPSNWTPQSPSRSMRLWTELIPIEMASIKSRTRMTPNPRLVHGLSPQGLFSNARVLAKAQVPKYPILRQCGQ